MGAFEIAHALGESHRLVQLYPPGHPARDEAIEELVGAVRETVEVRPVALNQRQGRLYEDNTLITHSTTGTGELIGAMEAHGIEALTFRNGFRDTDANGISEVLGLRPSPDVDVLGELDARRVRAVIVSEFEDVSLAVLGERQKKRASERKLYRQALEVLRELSAALTSPDSPDETVVARTLGPLISRMRRDAAALPSLMTLPAHGDALTHHGVAVMLGSLVIGHASGLDEDALLELGCAGLLHDIGFASASEDEATERLHPVVGAQMLGDLPDESLTAMLAAFEHHIGADGQGWPEHPADFRPHAFTRVVRVADRYDKLVRPAEGFPIRPDEAILTLLQETADGSLDPAMVRLFVQTMGVLPVGSVVRLSDHTVGVVSSQGEDPLEPRIMAVLDTDGLELRPPQELHLRQDEREIVEVIDAALMDIRPAEFV